MRQCSGGGPGVDFGPIFDDFEEHFERILGDILVPLGSISTHVFGRYSGAFGEYFYTCRVTLV